MSLIDLQNVYESVPYGFIHFALCKYHFPQPVCKLFFNYYYELLLAFVVVPNSSDLSRILHLGVGIFKV